MAYYKNKYNSTYFDTHYSGPFKVNEFDKSNESKKKQIYYIQ